MQQRRTPSGPRILAALNSPEFVDLAPVKVYTKLLDQGIYLGSLSTFYRVLEENKQVKERRRPAKHPSWTVPELVATAPGQVYTWDITKLAGPVKGKYFDCYMMVDIHSRFIVGAHVHATESGALAVEMMKGTFGIHGIPQVVHADRGTPMTSKTVTALLSDLEVTRSHSRPRVSNDNPYSEALFKTLKYGPEFRECFASVHDAGAFISGFVDWYNHHHQHSGIGFHARERPLRPRRRHHQGTIGNPRDSPRKTPRTLHHHHRPQNPRAPGTGVDQPTQGKHRTVSRLTPVGTAQLEKSCRASSQPEGVSE
ncbi:MAG: Mobile element protein [Arthrobacter sp.]|nr:Mobile element protein [Arthrobacter sp.]